LSVPFSDIAVRLVAAALLGGILGLNRNLRGKAAGLRTHALVSLGAAVAVLTADLIVGNGPGAERGAVTRAIQGIVAGVGFLGAGAILKTRSTRAIRGLTTASVIWLAATIGIACGAGYWRAAALAVGLALIVLTLGRPLENVLDRAFGRPVREKHHAHDTGGGGGGGAPGGHHDA
jgi:putative Mg2+ transporter-C (MgtC) family protein